MTTSSVAPFSRDLLEFWDLVDSLLLESGLAKGKPEWDPSKTRGPEQECLLPEFSSNII